MPNAHESNDDRLARRRARRWERRVRLFAPFLAVPGMLVVLVLSVNLIEHRPDPATRGPASSARRPAATRPSEPAHAASAPSVPTSGGVDSAQVDGHALSAEAVIATAVAADMPLAAGVGTADESTALFDAPAPTAVAPGAATAR
ncbi:MAG: hypothetical protein U0900_09185 [Myxococcota bacterium]